MTVSRDGARNILGDSTLFMSSTNKRLDVAIAILSDLRTMDRISSSPCFTGPNTSRPDSNKPVAAACSRNARFLKLDNLLGPLVKSSFDLSVSRGNQH